MNALLPRALARALVSATVASALAGAAAAQVFDERFDDWPVEHRIRGTVAVAHSLLEPAMVARARLTGREGAPALLLVGPAVDDARVEGYAAALPDLAVTRYERLADHDLAALLADRALVCWETAAPPTGSDLAHLRAARDVLATHVDAGRALCAVGPGARWLGGALPGPDFAEVVDGLGLLPDVALEPDRARLASLLAVRPRAVGVALEPDTLLVLRRRRCSVFGASGATFMLAANERQPRRVAVLRPSRGRGERDGTRLVDLTEWRRDAIDRTLEPFPPAAPRPPVVENGALLIVGGGGLPDGLVERFIELAGGPREARLVYVPCSEQDDVGPRQRTVEDWQRRGVKHATFVHTKDRARANEDEAFLAPLRDATGIWFGGGRQWNFADSYYGTTAHRLMKDVLARGGVIGGSSAGASIQGRYLARATPIGNTEIMAPGYERGGLGFLSGVAIDQHFTQRGRQPDMTRLVDRYPQLLGIGIDETTALEVQGSVARVLGKGRVSFYDRRRPVVPGEPDHVALGAGTTFDLVERR